MYKDKQVCVVVPAYNEEKLIQTTIASIPDYVDKIIVVDDCSQDKTVQMVESLQESDNAGPAIDLIQHKENQGVGGAIATGYKKARDGEIDIAVVMAGDGQMHPDDFKNILEPVANGDADYSKGNRLFYGDAWKMIPHYRYLGNSCLSLMTKIASGYWHIADSQSGYTAISLLALKRIDLEEIYKWYGMPNDLLIKLNKHDFTVRDVHVRPVYNIGEKSGIKLVKVIPRISWLLFKGFWNRLIYKYVIKDFHPLVFFYLLSFVLLGLSIPLAIRLFYVWGATGNIPDINAMALIFSLISGLQTIFFGMWFDMDYNKNLN